MPNENLLYFERQYGSLCGKHCLNNALQGAVFTEVELAQIGRELDEAERKCLAEGSENGESSNLGHRFHETGSLNYDDTGYFSVQVLQKALWDKYQLTMNSFYDQGLNITSQPGKQRLFIIHEETHWFCFRRIRNQWFNMNSLLLHPSYMSFTYLGEYLATLRQAKHIVFHVTGDLPWCPALNHKEFDEVFYPKSKEPKPKRGVEPPIMYIPRPEKPSPTFQSLAKEDEVGLSDAEIIRRRREALLAKVEKSFKVGSPAEVDAEPEPGTLNDID